MPASASPTRQQNNQMYRKYMQNMVVIYKNRQDLRLFAEILLTSATAVVFILFAIKPTLTTITDLYTEMQVKEETLATMETKIENLRAAESIYQKESTRLALLAEAIPQTPIPETFIRQIESLAQKNSVTLISLSIDKANITNSLTQPQSSIENIAISLSLLGNYQNIRSFLTDLESTRRPLKVQASTSALNTDVTESAVTLTLTGQIPYIRKTIANTASK